MTGFTPTEDKLSRLAMKVFDKVGGDALGIATSQRGAAVELMADTNDLPAYFITNGRMGSLTGIRLGANYGESLRTLRRLWQGMEVGV